MAMRSFMPRRRTSRPRINLGPLQKIYLGRGSIQEPIKWLQAWYLETGPHRLPSPPCQGHPETSPLGLVFPNPPCAFILRIEPSRKQALVIW